jgi:hypothetical protein
MTLQKVAAEHHPGCPRIFQSADVGEEEVADLGFVLERGFDFRKRVFQVPMLVGKGKRCADLFEARGVLQLAQEPIGLQGLRGWKTPRIEIQGRCPGQKPCPCALVRCETVSRKIPTLAASISSAESP